MLTRRELLVAAALPAAAAAADPLRVGLLPYLSPAALLAAFRPLREHLERQLGQPVEMATGKDFRSLADAVRRGDFDLAVMPANLSRVAMLDWRWQAIAMTVDSLVVLVVVAADGPVRTLADLAGQRVGTLDPLTLTASVGRRWLPDQRLATPAIFETAPSINSAMHQLERGELAAMVMADTQLAGLPPDTPRRVRVLARITDVPGPIWIARPDMAGAEVARVGAALLAFEPQSTRAETAANARLHRPDPGVLARLDGYAAIARQAFAAGR